MNVLSVTLPLQFGDPVFPCIHQIESAHRDPCDDSCTHDASTEQLLRRAAHGRSFCCRYWISLTQSDPSFAFTPHWFGMEASSDILTGARDLREGLPCAFAEKRPIQGGSHRVFKLVFEDSVQWAARICERPGDWEYDVRAIRIFQHIKNRHPDLRSPSVFFKEDRPVLYSGWVEGEPLAVWNLDISLQKRQRLLNDLAEFLLQLWTIPPPPPGFVHAPDRPYSTWLTESLDRGVRRTLSGEARWGDPIDYLIMRSMIPAYASEFDHYTEVGVAHGDLNARNIMRSDDFHLTG